VISTGYERKGKKKGRLDLVTKLAEEGRGKKESESEKKKKFWNWHQGKKKTLSCAIHALRGKNADCFILLEWAGDRPREKKGKGGRRDRRRRVICHGVMGGKGRKGKKKKDK